MSISVSQSPRQRPQMSCFVHNAKIISLLSERRKESKTYSLLRSWNQRILTYFLKPMNRLSKQLALLWCVFKCNLVIKYFFDEKLKYSFLKEMFSQQYEIDIKVSIEVKLHLQGCQFFTVVSNWEYREQISYKNSGIVTCLVCSLVY